MGYRSMKFGIGQPVRRVEDFRLITGQGLYTDDIVVPQTAQAFVLRSPVAHATIKRVDTGKALTLDFVTNQSSLTKTGDGVLAITGSNIFDGGSIFINAGTLRATTDSIAGVAGIAFSAGPLAAVPSLVFEQTQDGGIRTTISGNGRLIKTGAGELRLFGENSYSGGTIVSAGTFM